MKPIPPTNGFLVPPLKPKGRTTFLSTWFGNLVIRRLNALLNLKVQEGNAYDFKVSDANAILTIKRQIESTSTTGSSLTVYKITSISNLSSNYIAGKTVSFDNSNAETLGASAVNIAIPWALRDAQAITRTPEYAVNDYILVTTCDDGTGVVVSSAQLALEDLGIGRSPGGTKVERFRIRTSGVHDNYLTCETWDGTTGGGVDIQIAKPPKLRHVASESIAGVTWNYTYSSETGYEDGKRVASDGTNSEKQVVIPVYIIGDEIFASKPLRGTDVTVSSVECTYMDINVDGRAWARKFVQ